MRADSEATAPEWRSDDVAPPDGSAWDLLVVGGGTAGIVAAKTAAGFGAQVLLVEQNRPGGDCLWTGCVPSKAILAAAHAAADARAAHRFGIGIVDVEVDFAAVMTHVRRTITAIEPADSPAALRAAGIRVANATARFTGPDTADVAGTEVRFRQALLATGATPVMPSIPGLAETNLLTSETVWSLGELPKRLLVLGGGGIGCELGQAFARLGSSVTIVESASRLLPREDEDAAAVVTEALIADGVSVRTGVSLNRITLAAPGRDAGWPEDAEDAEAFLIPAATPRSGWRASLADGSETVFDAVLVAVGRRPRTVGLGLAEAGVVLDDSGHVRVDGRLRTSNPRISAAGDVTGHPPFTHTAGVHGSLAATNAILGLRRTVDIATMPRVTFTQPEVAAFGVSAERADRFGLTVRTVRHGEVDRAVAEGHVAGFTRLVLDRRSRVVGATIVGPRAGESLAEVVLAARHGLRARDIAASTHAYPTYGDGVWKAAIEQVVQQLRSPGTAWTMRALSRVRRRWLAR